MRVLIVDDSQLDLKILRESLEVNGINVIEAKNGKECLEKLNKNFNFSLPLFSKKIKKFI